jgi:hypothetical protein
MPDTCVDTRRYSDLDRIAGGDHWLQKRRAACRPGAPRSRFFHTVLHAR